MMISVVIPNYNSGRLLAKNLPRLTSILKKSGLEYEIIVSDDCSADGSVAVITGLHPVKLVTSQKNTGFGMCCDRGIKASKGEIVFLLNAADLLPQKPDYFKLMLKHFEDRQVFGVAAAKKDHTGIHGCGEVYFERGFYLHRHKPVIPANAGIYIDPGSSPGMTTDWADGGAQAIRREYYDKIGGFDPKYFLYWEDVDLGFRARAAGYKVIYEPKAILIHQKREGPIAKRFSPQEIRKMNLKAQFYFTWKNSDLKHKLLFLLWLPYHLAIAVKNKDWNWFRAALDN